MFIPLIVLLAALAVPTAEPAASASGPCELLDKSTATSLLGAPIGKMEPSGPEMDDDSGGMRSVCVYQAGQVMLIVLTETFKSAAEANERTTSETVGERTGDDNVTVEETSGVGDRSFWVRTSDGANFVAVKGEKILSIMIGGAGKEPQSYQASLRAATTSALKKL